VTNCPSISFSLDSSSRFASSSPARTDSSTSMGASPPPNKENCPAASALRSAMIGAATFSKAACSPICCTMPPRAYPSESKAPAKIKDSSTRFVSDVGSTRLQNSPNDVNGPPLARASKIACTTPPPTLRTAESP
jgi:hypothetical protein